MHISSCIFTFELHGVSSLKGRRAVTNSIKEKLKQFNLSVLDISSQYPREAVIAVTFLSPGRAEAAQYREKILSMLERNFPEWPYEMECEEL